MKEGEKEEDVDINIEILPNILKNILDNSYKQKADSLIDCRHCKVYALVYSRCCNIAERTLKEDPRDVEGDRQKKLEAYCN